MLEEGPWCFDDNLVVLQGMCDDDTTASVVFCRCDFWVRASRVPFSSFSKTTPMVITNMVGSFVFYDEYI